MSMRQRRPRVHLTYTVDPVRRISLGVQESFASDDPADADIWGTAVAEAIQGRVQGEGVRTRTSLVVELTTPTERRYHALLESALERAIGGAVGHLFASVVCQIRG